MAFFQHCTEVQFAIFQSSGFITVIVVNPPESKLAKCTSVHCTEISKEIFIVLLYNGCLPQGIQTFSFSPSISEKIYKFWITVSGDHFVFGYPLVYLWLHHHRDQLDPWVNRSHTFVHQSTESVRLGQNLAILW